MAILRQSPNVYLTWSRRFAQAVGIPYSGPMMPARTTCPLCQGNQFRVYEDVAGKGNWYSCLDCQGNGDLIELAAAVWGMQPDTALIRLREIGLPLPEEIVAPDRLDDYLVQHIQYRRHMQQAWQQARECWNQSRSPAISSLRARFRLNNDNPREQWVAGAGQLIGCLPCSYVEKLFCPKSADTGSQHPFHGYGCNPSAGRVFKGKGWDEVLTIPYYDLPERISSFLFIGRQGGEEDCVFRVLRHGFSRGTVPEAGIAWLPIIMRQPLSRTFVAVSDPLLALRMQVRHTQTSLHLLPLLAWHDGPQARTAAAWKVLEGRTVVFWASRLDHQVLHQAIQANGHLAVMEMENGTNPNSLLRNSPADLVRRIINQAKPWRQALRDCIDQWSEGVIEDLLLRLLPLGHSLQKLCEDLGSPEQLVRLFERPERERTARIGKVWVIEHEGSWYVGPSRRRHDPILISDAILRLDNVIVKEGQGFYSGRILFRGEELPFADVPSAVMETKKAPAWLRRFLLASGKGIAKYLGHHFGLTLFDVALAFQAPQPFVTAND